MILSVDDNGYVVYFIKEGDSDTEYDSFMDVFSSKPETSEGIDYKLKYPELEWEEVIIEEDDLDEKEIFNILFGGAE